MSNIFYLFFVCQSIHRQFIFLLFTRNQLNINSVLYSWLIIFWIIYERVSIWIKLKDIYSFLFSFERHLIDNSGNVCSHVIENIRICIWICKSIFSIIYAGEEKYDEKVFPYTFGNKILLRNENRNFLNRKFYSFLIILLILHYVNLYFFSLVNILQVFQEKHKSSEDFLMICFRLRGNYSGFY